MRVWLYLTSALFGMFLQYSIKFQKILASGRALWYNHIVNEIDERHLPWEVYIDNRT